MALSANDLRATATRVLSELTAKWEMEQMDKILTACWLAAACGKFEARILLDRHPNPRAEFQGYEDLRRRVQRAIEGVATKQHLETIIVTWE